MFFVNFVAKSGEFGEMSVRKAVELAVQYDKLIDLHCDETDDDQSRFLELLTALVIPDFATKNMLEAL